MEHSTNTEYHNWIFLRCTWDNLFYIQQCVSYHWISRLKRKKKKNKRNKAYGAYKSILTSVFLVYLNRFSVVTQIHQRPLIKIKTHVEKKYQVIKTYCLHDLFKRWHFQFYASTRCTWCYIWEHNYNHCIWDPSKASVWHVTKMWVCFQCILKHAFNHDTDITELLTTHRIIKTF